MEETKSDIDKKTGGKRKITLVEIDLSSEQNCQELIKQHKTEHGDMIDVLYGGPTHALFLLSSQSQLSFMYVRYSALNHGLQHANTDITTLPTEDWMETFQVNLHSFFFIVKAALPSMPEGGSIVMNASINFAIGHPELIDYTATKGAMIGFMRGLSNQVAPSKGIRVNGPYTFLYLHRFSSII